MDRRKRRRRKRKVLPRILLALALLAAVLFLLDRKYFVVHDVEVTGVPEEERAYVIRTSGIGMGTSLRTLDEEGLAQSLLRSGRYVLSGVRRELPDRVVLEVTLRTPAMVTEYGGHSVILDRDMVVISVGSDETEGLLRLTNTGAQTVSAGRTLGVTPARAEAASAIYAGLETNGCIGRILEADLGDPTALSLYTDRGLMVELGGSESMEKKIAWMIYAIRDLDQRGEYGGRLDVSTGKQADYMPE